MLFGILAIFPGAHHVFKTRKRLTAPSAAEDDRSGKVGGKEQGKPRKLMGVTQISKGGSSMILEERLSLWIPQDWRVSIPRICLSANPTDDLYIAPRAVSLRPIEHTIAVRWDVV